LDFLAPAVSTAKTREAYTGSVIEARKEQLAVIPDTCPFGLSLCKPDGSAC
jgi:hypothetical protein